MNTFTPSSASILSKTGAAQTKNAHSYTYVALKDGLKVKISQGHQTILSKIVIPIIVLPMIEETHHDPGVTLCLKKQATDPKLVLKIVKTLTPPIHQLVCRTMDKRLTIKTLSDSYRIFVGIFRGSWNKCGPKCTS